MGLPEKMHMLHNRSDVSWNIAVIDIALTESRLLFTIADKTSCFVLNPDGQLFCLKLKSGFANKTQICHLSL